VEMAQNPPTTTNQQKLGIKPKKHYSKVVSEPAESSTKEQGATPSASAQQPTFSVTNPSGSIVNQDSTVNAPQTVNNYGPTKLELDVERLRGLTKDLKSLFGKTVSLSVHQGNDDIYKLRDQFMAAFKENNIQLSE